MPLHRPRHPGPEPLIDFYCKLQGIEVLLTLRDGQWTAPTANRSA